MSLCSDSILLVLDSQDSGQSYYLYIVPQEYLYRGNSQSVICTTVVIEDVTKIFNAESL